MKYAVNSKTMKDIDDYTVDRIKIPAMVLMERAAVEIVALIKKCVKKEDRILVICGAGNNGGDGIATGRILYLQGYHVAILFIGNEAKITGQTQNQLQIAKNLGIQVENNYKLSEYNIIVDAIFGVGLSRPIAGKYATIIDDINNNDNIVFSVDIPSGIAADSGKVMNTAVQANYTITFGFQKQGLLLYPGTEYSGEIIVADIGFPEQATQQVKLDTFYYELEDLERIPARKKYSHKGTYGKVLVIAGSDGMSGAAYLSAKAAYKTGAGLVKIVTSANNRIIIQSAIPEALFSAYDDVNNVCEIREKFIETISWASVVVIGPGLGMSKVAEYLLFRVIEEAKVPVIIDADGLNLLASRLDSKKIIGDNRLSYINNLLKENTVLTPHLMELSRLVGKPMSEIVGNIIDIADNCIYNSKLIYTFKDARTIVAQKRKKYINLSGNNGMATGGSGDVLTGMIAALIAQGLEPYEATCLAVYIHGLAGDVATGDKGNYALMASDIIDSIEKIMRIK